MNYVLFVFLFAVTCYLTYIMTGQRKDKVKCKTHPDLFVITYKERTIYISAKEEEFSYRRNGNLEFIDVVIGWEEESLQDVEDFITKARTSILVQELFRFSAGNEPKMLMFFDPINSKELVEIHNKLKAFIMS